MNKETSLNKLNVDVSVISINDRWMFLYLYPLLSILVVHIGNDNSFFDLLQNPTYYSDLILSIICCYLIGFYLLKIYAGFNKRFNWGKDLKRIALSALLFGVILPTVMVTVIEVMYLIAINIDVLSSSVFYLELPLVFVFSVLLNLIYLFLYNTEYARIADENLYEKKVQQDDVVDHFAVGSGVEKKIVDKKDIAYFLVDNQLTFLLTYNGNRYLIDYPLKIVQQKFSGHDFFLLNRQVLANRKSILSYKRTETRRLKILLTPPMESDVFVAKSKAKQFTDWISLS